MAKAKTTGHKAYDEQKDIKRFLESDREATDDKLREMGAQYRKLDAQMAKDYGKAYAAEGEC